MAFNFQIGVDDSRFVAGMKNARDVAAKAGRSVGASIDRMADVTGKSFRRVGRDAKGQLQKAGSAATTLGKLTRNSSRQIDSSLRRVRKATLVTRSGFKTLGSTGTKSMRNLAKEGTRTSNILGNAFAFSLGNLATSITTGISAATRELVQFTAALERADAEISTLVDTSKVNVGDLVQEARALSAELGVEGVEATKSFYQALSATGDPIKAMSLLRNATKLATGGIAGLKESTELLSSVQAIYVNEVGASISISDRLFTAVKQGRTDISKLASAFPAVASSAKLAGVGLDESLAAMAAITLVAPTTAQAGTQMTAFLKAFIQPAQDSAKAAAAIGFQLNTATIESKGFAGALAELKARVDEQVKSGRTQADVLGKIFRDTESLKGATALLDTQFGKFNQNLDGQAKAFGAIDIAAAKVSATLGQKLTVELAKTKNEAAKATAELGTFFNEIDAGTGFIKTAGTAMRNFIVLLKSSIQSVFGAVSQRFRDMSGNLDAFVTVSKQAAIQVSLNFKKIQRAVESRITSFRGAEVIKNLTSDIERLEAASKSLGVEFSKRDRDRSVTSARIQDTARQGFRSVFDPGFGDRKAADKLLSESASRRLKESRAMAAGEKERAEASRAAEVSAKAASQAGVSLINVQAVLLGVAVEGFNTAQKEAFRTSGDAIIAAEQKRLDAITGSQPPTRQVGDKIRQAVERSRVPTGAMQRKISDIASTFTETFASAAERADAEVRRIREGVADRRRFAGPATNPTLERSNPISATVASQTFDLSSLEGIRSFSQAFLAGERANRSRGIFVRGGELQSPEALLADTLRRSGVRLPSIRDIFGGGAPVPIPGVGGPSGSTNPAGATASPVTIGAITNNFTSATSPQVFDDFRSALSRTQALGQDREP